MSRGCIGLLVGLLAGTGILTLCGCQLPAGPGIRLWAAEPETQLAPDSEIQSDNEVFSEPRATISLAGAVNETLAFQLVVPGRATADAVTAVRLGDLKGAQGVIPAQHTAVYREAAVRVDACPAWFYQRTAGRRAVREYLDILIPVASGSTALPAPMAPGRNAVFWVDVWIPPGTSAGTYAGSVEVQTQTRMLGRLRIELEVWPFALPDTPHVVALAPLEWSTLVAYHLERDGKPYRPQRLAVTDPLRPAALAVLDATFQLLRRHRCQALLTDLQPLRQATADGPTLVDWSDYDAVATAYLDGSAFEDRIPLPVWPLPMDENHPAPASYGGLGSSKYAEALREAAESCLAHARQGNWLDRHMVPLLTTARHTGDEYAAYRAIASVFRAASPNMRLWCDLPPQPMEPFGWTGHAFVDLAELVGVWCPPARFADPAVMAALRKRGVKAWWQPDFPPYSGSVAVVSPPIDVRSIPWQTAAWPSDAVWLAGTAGWPAEPPAGGVSKQADASTTWLLYPGREFGVDAPIPSVRLKHLRAGLQDAEYLWLLRQQGRPAIADLVAGGLFMFGGAGAYGEHYADGRAHGWIRDPSMWRLGRLLLATELKRAAAGEPGEGFEQFRQRIDWQRFLRGTRRTLGWAEGARVRPEPTAGPEAVRADVLVSLLNQTLQPAVATAECPSSPPGWRCEERLPRFDVPPGQIARRSIAFRSAAVDFGAFGAHGIVTLPIRLDTQRDDAVEVPARLAAIKAQRITRPITIDGRLNDWPAGIGNVAGDFVLVGAQDVPKAGPGRPDRPSQATLAFVCHDNESLYIAFHCEEQRLDRREIAQTSFLRYEGMTPVGEDLVEVLFDPGAAATGPGDLYHLVVKANGSAITERGIGCQPPIGPHRAWPADVRVGIDAQSAPDRWYIEIQVRLDAFGKDAKRQPWWGVNFARLQSRLGEYSTWSGARWNVYTPTTLGNLHMEP